MNAVDLPWPHKLLWPNGSTGNRYHKSRETKAHKEWAWAAAKAAKLVAPDGRIPVQLIFYPKPRGPAPDKDNCQASAKAYLDGIAKAMGVDDRLFDPDTKIASERLSKVTITVGSAVQG